MKDFTASLQFIVFFLVLVIIISMTLGSKVATGFLWLVLLGMMVTNSDKMTALIGRFSGGGKAPTNDMGNGVYLA